MVRSWRRGSGSHRLLALMRRIGTTQERVVDVTLLKAVLGWRKLGLLFRRVVLKRIVGASVPQDGLTDRAVRPRWNLLKRVVFRLAFSLLGLMCLFESHGVLFGAVPVVGRSLGEWLRTPVDALTIWFGVHVVHLTGRAASIHEATGDRALAWVAMTLILLASAAITLVWSVLDRRRLQYARLFLWFRWGLSVTLGLALLPYALIKIFPLQFPSPPLALLNEPVGNASPTLLFWSLYGLRPSFEMLLGWVEVLTALLLLFRRSALAGALLALGVTANIALLDTVFDVPVKLWSFTLVLMSLVLLLPETKWIFSFFFSRQALPQRPSWAPQGGTPRARRAVLLAEVLFVCIACGTNAWGTWTVYHMKLEALSNPPGFVGKWQIDGQSGMRGGDGQPIKTVFFDPNSDMMLQDAQGAMWRSRSIYQQQTRTLRVLYEAGGFMMFTVDQGDANNLQLTPKGPTAAQMGTVKLTRVPIPQRYPLLDPKFHWVNEFEPLH